MGNQPPPDALADQVRFVFRGTVEAVHASTMPQVVPATDQTCIVHVDEVLQSPQSLAHAAGEQVTVLLPSGTSVSPHQQAVFFANPWLYGDTLGVQALGVHDPGPTLATMSRQTDDPVRTLVERDRQARLNSADLVVRGRVSAVRLADRGAELRHTEHAPLWQDAVVDVQAVEKGADPGPQVVIRFPASSDIAFSDRPKFTPGQAGRFILRRWAPEDGAHDQAGATPLFTADHRWDFQPTQELLSVESPSGLQPT